ncbi:unnamed protein product, partial [Allacma fusca]
MTYRVCTNFLHRSFHLAEGIVCLYVALYQVIYCAFLFNSWLYWESIPTFINQWLLFNRNSAMVSIMLEDDNDSEGSYPSDGPEIPPEMETDSTDSIIEVHSNKSAHVRHVWKKSIKKVYKRRNRKS